MRYIVLSDGDLSCVGTTENYTELGWELMVTRLAFIRDFNNGLWNKDDTVITISDRKFLYSKLCNTIDSSSLELKDGDTVFTDYTNKMTQYLVDLHSDYEKGLIQQYKYLCDKPQILSVDYEDVESKYNIKDKFAGVLVRIRNHVPERNMTEDMARSIINDLLKMYSVVFVFGLGSKYLADGKRVIYLETLREWASVMNSKLCDCIIGTASGASQLCQICCNSKLVLIPNGGPIQRHALYHSDHVTFSNLKILLAYDKNQIIDRVKAIRGAK